MFDKLKEINQRPRPFQEYTAEELWTKKHTSKKMLELKYYQVSRFKDILKNKSYLSEENADPLIPPTHRNLRGSAYYYKKQRDKNIR